MDASFDAVLCIGYHAQAVTQGVLHHTINGGVVYNILVNGESQGELGLNAGIATYFDTPIVLLTGDTAAAAEATELIPGIEVAAVKEPLTRYAAKCLSPSAAQDLIRRQAKRALERRGDIPQVRYTMPVTLTLQVRNSAMADVAEMIPGVDRTGPLTISYASDDYLEAFNCLLAMIMVAGAGG